MWIFGWNLLFNLFRGVELSQCAVFLILQVVCPLLCFSESFSELLYLFLDLPLSLVEAGAYKTFLIRLKDVHQRWMLLMYVCRHFVSHTVCSTSLRAWSLAAGRVLLRGFGDVGGLLLSRLDLIFKMSNSSCRTLCLHGMNQQIKSRQNSNVSVLLFSNLMDRFSF